MVVVPPPFEAVIKAASSSDTEHIVRYPILLTVEVRASLLISSRCLSQVHSTNPFLSGSHLPRLSWKNKISVLLLFNELKY
jgi:hypothetical protein